MKLTLFAAVFAVALASCYGLKCYTCDGGDSSVADTDCGDTFDTSNKAAMLTTCPATSKFCSKQKSGVNHVYNRIIRKCDDTCEEKNILYVDRTTCCTTDGCNSGNGLVPTLAGLVFAVVSFFALK